MELAPAPTGSGEGRISWHSQEVPLAPAPRTSCQLLAFPFPLLRERLVGLCWGQAASGHCVHAWRTGCQLSERCLPGAELGRLGRGRLAHGDPQPLSACSMGSCPSLAPTEPQLHPPSLPVTPVSH